MEQLLLFHLDDNSEKKLRQVAGNLKIHLRKIAPADYRKTLDMLVSKTASPLIQPFCGEIPSESLLLFCDFTEKRMDKVLLSLRQHQIFVDYKAILTPTNRSWNVMRLYLELAAEKNACQKIHP